VSEPFPILRRILPFLSVGVVIAALYVGWIFYSRWSSTRDAAAARTDKEAAEAKRMVDQLGGGEFKILNFYAVPGAIKPGERATLCFGTSETKTVKIDPPVEQLHPAISHCIEVSPRKTTTYTLTAEDGKGHTANQSLDLKVLP
jgi:hypothetical protein